MAYSTATKGMMKWPLYLAAAIVVLRVFLEQIGAPAAVNMVFGVAWLYFLVPVYFGMRITAAGEANPYKSLLKNTAIYALYTRLMVMPTYWLAYAFGWSAPRFRIDQGGVVGEGVTPLNGYLIIPVRNALIWIVSATIIGMIIGSITIAIRRKGTAKATA